MFRKTLQRRRKFGVPLILLLGITAAANSVFAHGVDHRIERGEAVMVHFTSQHDGAMAGVGFRVFAPDGQTVFSSGNTDALGRAVFSPDEPGIWRVLMATEDGHGAEVEVPIEHDSVVAAAGHDRAVHESYAGRIPATAAGIGYLFGLAGLLALWRFRR